MALDPQKETRFGPGSDEVLRRNVRTLHEASHRLTHGHAHVFITIRPPGM